MYINIQRKFFKNDLAQRFGKSFNCDPEIWRKVWYKHKILNYSRKDSRDYLCTILKIQIPQRRFDRWVYRTEIYLQCQIALKQGAKKVDSNFFGKYKEFVEKELNKNK